MDIAQNGGGTTDESQVAAQGGDHSEGTTAPEAVVKQDGETVEGKGKSLDEIESYRKMQRELNLRNDAERKAREDAEYWRKQWEGKASEQEIILQTEREEKERFRRENEEFRQQKAMEEARKTFDKLTSEEFPEFRGIDLGLTGDEETLRLQLSELKEKLAEPMKKNIMSTPTPEGPTPSSPAAGSQGSEENMSVYRSLDSREKKKEYIRRLLGNKSLRDVR
jgi:hypothetical protein